MRRIYKWDSLKFPFTFVFKAIILIDKVRNNRLADVVCNMLVLLFFAQFAGRCRNLIQIELDLRLANLQASNFWRRFSPQNFRRARTPLAHYLCHWLDQVSRVRIKGVLHLLLLCNVINTQDLEEVIGFDQFLSLSAHKRHMLDRVGDFVLPSR